MSTITLKGSPIHTIGDLPVKGTQAPDVELVKNDLSRVRISDYKGFILVLNIFPSIDTSVCATSVRTFNARAAGLNNTKVLCISRDLPFAQSRFCGANGIENVIMLSDYARHEFGKSYQLEIIDGPMAGLLSRAVIILDQNGKVVYTQQVPEISQEPDYEKALEAATSK